MLQASSEVPKSHRRGWRSIARYILAILYAIAAIALIAFGLSPSIDNSDKHFISLVYIGIGLGFLASAICCLRPSSWSWWLLQLWNWLFLIIVAANVTLLFAFWFSRKLRPPSGFLDGLEDVLIIPIFLGTVLCILLLGVLLYLSLARECWGSCGIPHLIPNPKSTDPIDVSPLSVVTLNSCRVNQPDSDLLFALRVGVSIFYLSLALAGLHDASRGLTSKGVQGVWFCLPLSAFVAACVLLLVASACLWCGTARMENLLALIFAIPIAAYDVFASGMMYYLSYPHLKGAEFSGPFIIHPVSFLVVGVIGGYVMMVGCVILMLVGRLRRS